MRLHTHIHVSVGHASQKKYTYSHQLTIKLVQVKETQKRRKVSQIKEYLSSTLEQCMSSHGLAPTVLSAVSADGNHITIPLTDNPTCSQVENQSTAHSTEAVTARTLYLLDRFAVSDTSWLKYSTKIWTPAYVCPSIYSFNTASSRYS